MARALPPHHEPDHELVHRSCPLCEAHCGITIEVDRSSEHVVTIRGDADDPRSRGFLCPKAYALKGIHEDPDRLRRPQRRVGRRGDPDSAWEEIGWDEAFDLAGAGLRSVRDSHGANAIATFIGNPAAHDLGSILYGQLLQRALGTRWRFSASSVDQLPKMLSSAFLYGNPLSIPVPDLDRTDYLLMLGANPLVSNGSLCTAPDFPGRLAKLRARGGRVVVVDPRRTETARVADEHLAIRPGSDAYFLFAIVNVLFREGRVALGRLEPFTNGVEALRTLAKEFPPEAVAAATGISVATLRRIARDLARTERAVVYGRIGTCTQAFGTLSSWLVDVVNALSGHLDRPGGAMWPRAATGPALDPPRRPGPPPYARWRSHLRGLPEFAGELPAACLAEEIDAAPEAERVRALVTLAGNPVLSAPDAGRLDAALPGLDCMVSLDNWLNETTRHAHVILPGHSVLEQPHYDELIWGWAVRNAGKYSPPVFPADSGRPSRPSEWEVLLTLAALCQGQKAADVDTAALDDLFFAGLVATVAADPRSAIAGRDPGEIVATCAGLDGARGPGRLLDFAIRSGPWGDRFGEDPEGLTLAKVAARPHGLDRGALEPRLDEVLRTPSGKIELAPEHIVRDVPRLRERLGRGAPPLVLVSRRHVRSNNSWMHNVPSLVTGRDRCTLLVHPDDADRLGLADGGAARVASAAGSLTAPVEVTDEMRPGVVCLPHGWGHDKPGTRLSVAREHAGVCNNVLAPGELVDVPSGNAVVNGIPVEVSPA